MIIDARFEAGLTIEEAIGEALDFSEKTGVAVCCNLNDITVFVLAGLPVGGREEQIRHFRKQYNEALECRKELYNENCQ